MQGIAGSKDGEATTYKDTNANSIAAGKCKFVAKNSGILFVQCELKVVKPRKIFNNRRNAKQKYQQSQSFANRIHKGVKKLMDLYEVESKIKDLEASYNKEADNLMQELNAYKKKNPILPLYGDDPNVDKMIANKNRIIRSQYTRRENKIHKLWEKFYDEVTNIVTAEYNLPTDVAKLVVQQVRDRDIGRSELTSYLDHYAIFAESVLDAVL